MSQDKQGYLDKGDLALAGVIIFGALGFTALLLLTICGFFALCRGSWRSNEGRRRSNNSIVREQSTSIVRGEHPIAFMLPTVSLSEAGSETDPTPSDLESLGYQSHSPSPSLSLASLTGNIYSPSPFSPTQTYQRPRPVHRRSNQPRPTSLPAMHSAFSSPRTSSLSSPRSCPSPQPPAFPSRPVRIPGSRDQSARSSPAPVEKDEEDDIAEGQSEQPQTFMAMGRLRIRLTFRPFKEELQVKILRGEDYPTNYRTGAASTSVKISILPSKLPKYSTEVVGDTVNPEYGEEFSFLLNKQEIYGKVLRLAVFDHDGSNKKMIGTAVLSLTEAGLLGDRDLEVVETWLNLKESVDSELTELLADRLELSLKYESTPGRLSLGVLSARIQSRPINDLDTEVYVKVTLFEGRRVIKAKKTRLIGISEEVHFNEKFSILLPPTFLDAVSCVISLCSRSRLGVKQVLGRTSVGPYSFCNGPGLDQWQTMIKYPGEEISVIHTMI